LRRANGWASYRQTKRAWSRIRVKAMPGWCIGCEAGRQSAVAGAENSVAGVVSRTYADYGPTLAAECLERTTAAVQ
jgi:hypothetical protein